MTHGGVVAQVWRGGRQALTARLLVSARVVALDRELGRLAGELLARTRTTDVIDAALVLLAHDGDEILTSDSAELRVLAEAAGKDVDLIAV